MAYPVIKVKKLHPKAIIPTKKHRFDAGYDLYASHDKKIPAGQTVRVETSIAIEIPRGYVGLIWDRSSIGSEGIHCLCGVIDFGYTGPVKVVMSNLNGGLAVPYYIKAGNKIAQLIIQEIGIFDLIEVEELSDSERGDKGFGSSGR
jgi:dUTP pyrophosphatase